MRVIGYLPNSIVDGVGIRQVFFLAGCPHHCKGCQNPQSWNPLGGEEWSMTTLLATALGSPFNVTFSGGEPFVQYRELYELCSYLHHYGKNIWVYTGFTWEELILDKAARKILEQIDVLVDGRFEEDKKNPELTFKGSENQRIIDVQKSLNEGKIVLWEEC